MDKDILKLIAFLADNNPDEAIIAIDADYKIVFANKKACELENMAINKIVGHSFPDIFYNGRKYNGQGIYLSPLTEAIDTGMEKLNVEFHPHGSRFFLTITGIKGTFMLCAMLMVSPNTQSLAIMPLTIKRN